MPIVLDNLPLDITLAEALELTKKARDERNHQTHLEGLRRYNTKHHDELLEKKKIYRESHREELAKKNQEYRIRKKLQAVVKVTEKILDQK